MELLDAVNSCLSALGEARVTSTDTRHPSVDLILGTIKVKQKAILERGMWFNTYDAKMYPNDAGGVEYPASAISVQSGDSSKIYTKRNGMLFDVLANTEYFTKPITITVATDITFDNLPECVANVVMYRTMRAVYVGDLGYDATVSDMMQNEQVATLQMETLHMRNMQYSTRSRRGFARYMQALRG